MPLAGGVCSSVPEVIPWKICINADLLASNTTGFPFWRRPAQQNSSALLQVRLCNIEFINHTDFWCMKGWLTVIAWEFGQASAAFLGAEIIQGLIILNQPTYAPTRWQGTLLYYAVLSFMFFINTFLARWLPKVEGVFLCVHVIGFFAVLIPLVYLGPHGSAKDVFASFINGGGWSTDGLSFFVGIIASVYTFTGNFQFRLEDDILLTSTKELTARTIVRILQVIYSFIGFCFMSCKT
jgi:amino acid transporter